MRILKFLLFIFITTFCIYAVNRKTPVNAAPLGYSNPIDSYFLPQIENAGSEAERRSLQDTYRGVWKTEFENVMLWMQGKCVYQEDKDNLSLYAESVESFVHTSHTVLATEWLNNYNSQRTKPKSSRNI